MGKTLAAVAAAIGLGAASSASAGTAHEFSFKGLTGGEIALSAYEGKAVLVVNTASKCGFTPQYEGLQALWERYRDRGLVVLGVPSNDFGGQEPGSSEEIQEFCSVTFSVDFPMTDKQTVKGDDAHPFYRWANAQAGTMGSPKWNFHKYLIDPEGRFVDWFSTMTKPTDDKVTAAVEKVLPQ